MAEEYNGFESLNFDNSSDGGTKKERRFSVHDVEAEDNQINYGQPDNQAMTENVNLRIGSTSDDNVNLDGVDSADRDNTNRSSIHSDSHKSEDDDNPNIYIHENVDDNDEYANEHIDADANQYNEDLTDDQQQTGSGSNARDSKENTPEQEDDTNANADANNESKTAKDKDKGKDKEHFDTAHYRHPSLPANENPASDGEDYDKDHGRYLSTLIHGDVDS